MMAGPKESAEDSPCGRQKIELRWLPIVLGIALAGSALLNAWLINRVVSWKARTWVAVLFPEREFSRSLPSDPGEADQEIWIVGDSRVAMWPKTLLPEEPRFRILGRSGWTTREIADALHHALKNHSPAAIILQCGINDIQAVGYNPERRAEILAASERNFQRIRELTKLRNVPVVALSVLPRGPREVKMLPFWDSTMDRDVMRLNTFLESITEEGWYYVRSLDSVVDSSGFVSSEHAQDTLHLNEAGYSALTSHVLNECRRLRLLN